MAPPKLSCLNSQDYFARGVRNIVEALFSSREWVGGKKRVSMLNFTVYLGGKHVSESPFRAQSSPEKRLLSWSLTP